MTDTSVRGADSARPIDRPTMTDAESNPSSVRAMSPSPAAPPVRSGAFTRAWVQIAIILAVCAAIHWPMLGAAGFSGTEGHRAIPAYAMLDRGEWLVPSLFERPYLRKPPGMSWAIAGASEIFGRTEFAARSVSAAAATLSALVAWFFARRWFGSTGALFAGLSQALMPVFWSSSRSADIEALHNLGVQIAALSAIHAMLFRARSPIASCVVVAAVALGVVIAVMTKGPAGASAFGAAIIAACLASRSIRPLAAPTLWLGVAVALVVIGLVLRAAAQRAVELHVPPVTQSIDEFLWEPGRTLRVLGLLPIVFVASLPASLALLFPWGPDVRPEVASASSAPRDGFPSRTGSVLVVAQTLAIAFIASVLVLSIIGISNPRYAMPSQMLLPPLVGYVGLGLAGFFVPLRARIARWMSLGHPLVMGVGLLIASAVLISVNERRRERIDGREIGQRLADRLGPGAVVRADHLIDARPDVLHYATGVRPIWTNLTPDCPLPDRGELLALRDDRLSGEVAAYELAGRLEELEEIWRDEVYLYSFRVYRRRDPADEQPSAATPGTLESTPSGEH